MSTASKSNRTTPDLAPLPWHVGPHYHTDIYSRNGFVAETRPMQTPYAEANAEFIVRACNAHDDLLAALKQLKARVEELSAVKREGVTGAAYDVMTASIGDDITAEFLEAEEAIAKAEGR